MNVEGMLEQLDAEIARLTAAREVIAGLQGGPPRPGSTAPEPAARATAPKAALAVRQARPTGAPMSGPRAQVLQTITDRGPIATAAVAEILDMQPPSVLFHVKRLRNDGLVVAHGKSSKTTYTAA